MQSFGALLRDNSVALIVAFIAAIVILVIAVFLYRLVFGKRLHMTGGRSRQPRLGVVDAFDLDRQRQLVLVRRDNVEHLLMIGGPNDLVIESAFVRAQPSVALPIGRDKEGSSPPAPLIPMTSPAAPSEGMGNPPEFRTLTPAPPIEGPPPRAVQPPLDLGLPVSARDLGPLSDIPAPGPPAAAPPPPEPQPQPEPIQPPVETAPPAETAPVTAPAPRSALSRFTSPTPRPVANALPPRPPLTSFRTPTASPPATPRPPSLLPNRPTPLTPLQRGTSAASLRRDTPPSPTTPEASRNEPTDGGEAEPATAAPNAPNAPNGPSRPTTTDAPKSPAPLPTIPPGLPITLDSIESLEEEMAKLLGRAAGDKK